MLVLSRSLLVFAIVVTMNTLAMMACYHAVIYLLEVAGISLVAHDGMELLAVVVAEGLHLLLVSLHLLVVDLLALLAGHGLSAVMRLVALSHLLAVAMLLVGFHLLLLALLECLDLSHLLGWQTHLANDLHVDYAIHLLVMSLAVMRSLWVVAVMVLCHYAHCYHAHADYC